MRFDEAICWFVYCIEVIATITFQALPHCDVRPSAFNSASFFRVTTNWGTNEKKNAPLVLVSSNFEVLYFLIILTHKILLFAQLFSFTISKSEFSGTCNIEEMFV